MKPGLKKKIDRFYEEMYKEESWDIGELACDLIPELVTEIKRLEKRMKGRYYFELPERGESKQGAISDA